MAASLSDVFQFVMQQFPGGASFVEAPMPPGVPPYSESLAGALRGSGSLPLADRLNNLQGNVETLYEYMQDMLTALNYRHQARTYSLFDAEPKWPNDATDTGKMPYDLFIGWVEGQIAANAGANLIDTWGFFNLPKGREPQYDWPFDGTYTTQTVEGQVVGSSQGPFTDYIGNSIAQIAVIDFLQLEYFERMLSAIHAVVDIATTLSNALTAAEQALDNCLGFDARSKLQPLIDGFGIPNGHTFVGDFDNLITLPANLGSKKIGEVISETSVTVDGASVNLLAEAKIQDGEGGVVDVQTGLSGAVYDAVPPGKRRALAAMASIMVREDIEGQFS